MRNGRVPRRVLEEEELKPYQVELLKLQRYLEAENRRMIVLFEPRRGGQGRHLIRRVTRYMNEKHYRVVALGRPTEEQRSQWYSSATSRSSPPAARWCCSTGPGTTAPWWSCIAGTDEEHRNFKGVVGFEKDLSEKHHPGEVVLQRHQG